MRRNRRNRRAPVKIGFGSLLFILLAAVLLLTQRQDLWDTGQTAPPSPKRSFSAASQAMGDGLEVYYLDVGQGDSTLVRFSGEDGVWNMLIDTGEYAYADGLTECLRDLGVEKLDYFIVTHPHTDHMGCAARIVQRFQIGRFCMPRVPEDLTPTVSAYEALLDALNDKGITAQALDRQLELNGPEGLSLEVLAPREDADWDDLNNWSGVLRLTYGGTSFLFPGDAESQSEKAILEDAEARGLDLKTDVLKCGHHGSSTSSTAKFLKAVLPQYAVVSCGRDNDYGHPHKGTLDKLNKLGVQIYRTDQDGTVLAKSDGESLSFQTGLPSIEARKFTKNKE